MSDFLNKVVTLILIFIMLVLAPMLISYMMTDMRTQRLVLNEVSLFIDKVTDKGTITESDLDQLYLSVNSHGKILDVTVKRFVRVASLDQNTGQVRTLYFAADDISDLNPGDIVQVTIREVGRSPLRSLTYSMLKIDIGRFEFSLAGAVR